MKQWRCVELVECVALVKKRKTASERYPQRLGFELPTMVGSRLVKCFSENFSGELYVYPCTQDAQPSTCTRLCSVYGPRKRQCDSARYSRLGPSHM